MSERTGGTVSDRGFGYVWRVRTPLRVVVGAQRYMRAWSRRTAKRSAVAPIAPFALLSLSALLVMSGSAAAQRVSGVPLTLQDALVFARQNGPLHRAALAREQTALGLARESTQWSNPTLEWRKESFGSSLQPDIFTTALVPFDLTGRRVALRQSATAGKTRAQENRVVEWRFAELQVSGAWLRASVASEIQRALENHSAALREVADIDTRRLSEGLVSEAVGLRTSLEADRADLAVASARAETAEAVAELSRLMGRTGDSPVVLPPLTPPSLPPPPDSLQLRTLALRFRPEVLAGEAAVRETERLLAAEQRGVIGEVELQGGTKQTGGIIAGQIGIAMPLPLFNRNSGARQRSRGELMQARAHLDDARLLVEGAVRVALQRYNQIRDSEAAASTFTTRGRDVGDIARVAYSEGQISLVELLDAERASTDAIQAHLHWIVEAWLGRLELELAIGAGLDALGPLDLPVYSTLSSGR